VNSSFQKILKDFSLLACVIENPTDLLYLTGLELSKGVLLMEPEKATLFVDGRYLDAARKSSHFAVEPIEEGIFPENFLGRIGFDSSFVTYDRHQALCKQYPFVEWIACQNPLKTIRVCKTAEEIVSLKRAADLTAQGYRFICGLLKEGISEEELAFEFEFFCRKKGASGLSFSPIIAFGENSAYPHHRAGKTLLKKGQVVLIDVGAIVDQYRGDMTRIVFFGKADPKIIRLFEIVKKAQRKAVEAVQVGVKLGWLDKLVREEFRAEGVESLFTHGLGHGIGLDTHEYPRLKWDGEDADVPLKAGMVFTIEPGLYQPGLGGIRYEDTILVTERGAENFFAGVE
jgi:Xaa-Pro aminopeptidase